MIVITLIAINVIVFLIPYVLGIVQGGNLNFANFQFLRMGSNSAPEIRDGEYYRLLTSTFLHAGFLHLFVNMMSLNNLGVFTLQLFRNNNLVFLLVYILSGLGGSLASMYFTPNTPSVGASGAIMGLLGAVLAFTLITQDTRLLSNVLVNLVVIFAIGYLEPRIDNFGHLGGLITGFVIGAAFIFSGASIVRFR